MIRHMQSRSLVWIGLAVGSTVGGLIPELWGAGILSFSSIFLSALGGIAGIWVGYQIAQNF